MNLIIVTVQGCNILTVYYGLTYSVQDLGLDKVNYNGILLGVFQMIGYIGVSLYMHRMQRRKWTIIFQIVMMASAAVLILLSFFPDHYEIKILKAVMSAGVITICNAGQYSIFYAQLSEIFPSDIRGLVGAITIVISKLAASLSPLLSDMGKGLGFHVMVGCCVFGLVSLPLSFFQKETLTRKTLEE